MAVPTFATIGTKSVSASAATLTPALPASLVTNNILIAEVSVSATGKTFSVGGSWTIFKSINTGNMSGALAWRLVDGTQAAPVFTWTGAAACQAQVRQYTGNATVSPIGASNSATANSSTTLTAASLVSTADNSCIIGTLLTSTSQTIPLPTNYTSRQSAASVDGSTLLIDGVAYKSGTTTDAMSVTITSANWVSLVFELKGSGTTANEPAPRVSQVVGQVLETYSNPANIIASQSLAQVLEVYSNPANTFTSQVTIQVLRSVSVFIPKGKNRSFIIG